MNLRSKLLKGEAKIAVWGSGYIGFSTAAFYAVKGVKSICYDINPRIVEAISRGQPPPHIPTLQDWVPFKLSDAMPNIEATLDYKRVVSDDKVAVHFIAVNTERNGRPWKEALEDVVSKICEGGKKLVVIESTITPSWVDWVLDKLRGFKVAVAPRRDWFDDPSKTLESLPRVVGANSREALEEAKEVLGIVCKHLVEVSDCKVAAIVKAYENAQRFLNIILAEEFARAYPELNAIEVYRAAATKWNVQYLEARLGIGGYCIPLAPQYIIESATVKEELKALHAGIQEWFERRQLNSVISSITRRAPKRGRIAVLGLSYKRDTRVPWLSPSIELVKKLIEMGYEVYVHDPYFKPSELEELGIGEAKYVSVEEAISSADVVVLSIGHRAYRSINPLTLTDELRGKHLLDVEGIWEHAKEELVNRGVQYYRVGDQNWL
ncbi:MAG: hypothetical protein DRJ62_07270 [Thermoprotei archaeon]|nr:MAG: hypothetical protein DRJ62_07270 [Thermoprotei archaeon]